MPIQANFTIFQGTDPKIRIRLVSPESIVGWNTEFHVRETLSGPLILNIPGQIADLTEVPNAAEVGVFDIPLTQDQLATLKLKKYHYAFRRTGTAEGDLITYGIMDVATAA